MSDKEPIDGGEAEENSLQGPVADEGMEKFLIFSINEKYFAIEAAQVREIVPEASLYFIPFVPPYVRGFINRLGEPYTVFDLSVLLGGGKLSALNFLILSRVDDNVAIMMSDVVEIINIPQKKVVPAPPDSEHGKYLRGTFSSMGSDVSIINFQEIIQRLHDDLQE